MVAGSLAPLPTSLRAAGAILLGSPLCGVGTSSAEAVWTAFLTPFSELSTKGEVGSPFRAILTDLLTLYISLYILVEVGSPFLEVGSPFFGSRFTFFSNGEPTSPFLTVSRFGISACFSSLSTSVDNPADNTHLLAFPRPAFFGESSTGAISPSDRRPASASMTAFALL